MTKAKLVKNTVWYPPWADDAGMLEAAGTVGTICECECAGHQWDYHFYPDRMTDGTFFGVFDEEVEIEDESE